MSAPRILATAIADPVNGHIPEAWLVTVTGQPPYGERRTYQIEGEQGRAAMEGIDRFVEEMQLRGSVNAEGLA